MFPRFHPFVRLLFAALGALLVQGVVAVVIGAALFVAAQISHRPLTDFSVFAAHNQLLLNVLVYPPTLLWLWFCRRTFDRQSFRSLGLRASNSVRNFGSGALCGLLALTLLFGVLWSCGFVHVNGFSDAFAQNGARSILLLVLYALAFCCVGFTEEVIFRGYVFHNLTAWLGLRAAIWTQAILFGLIHLVNVLSKPDANGVLQTLPSSQWSGAFWDARWGILNIALIGVFFAQSYLKTGSLWFPIGFHAAWNFALGCLFSLNVSGLQTFRVLDVSIGNATATGGSFGAEGSVFLIAILAAMLWFLQREKNHPQALADLSLLNAKIMQQPLEAPEDVDEIEADDPTHVSRFRSSMRPLSSQPALKLNRAEFAVAPLQSGFTPVSATTPNSTSTTPNAPTIETPIISANALASNRETATEAAVVEVFEPVVATENPELSLPEIQTSSTRSAVSKPEIPPTPQHSIEEKPVTQTPLVELPVQETATETTPPVVASKPKKPAPKW